METTKNTEEFREIIRRLKEPFEPSAHVERDLPGGGKWLYIPWQKIRERLDEVCPDWQEEYTTPVYLDKYCTIGCTITINGVSRQRWGNAEIELLSRNGRDMSRGTAIERAVADAFKSAAESFGVAAYLDEQSDDRRQFTIRYLHSKGDGRALKAAKENGWIEGNLPTASEKVQMREREKAQRRAPANVITDPQRTRLWAIAKNDGKFTEAGFKRLIQRFGFDSSKAITTDKYGEICDRAKDPTQAEIYNREPEMQTAG